MFATYLVRIFLCFASIRAVYPTISVESVMKRVVKESFCSSNMTIGSIEDLHTCLKESKMSGNRIESECIEQLYPTITGYYTQVCNESVDVEVTPAIQKCMSDVCKKRGMDPYYDHYYCYYINHEADVECGLLALAIPDSIKQRAMMAHKITVQHRGLEKDYCDKLRYSIITEQVERLKVIECLIIPRKELYTKCVTLYNEKHSPEKIDPEILYKIECSRFSNSDQYIWVSFLNRIFIPCHWCRNCNRWKFV